MRFIYAKGATPYMEGDINNLIPQHITLQSELNEWEQANILEAEQWIFGRSRKSTTLTSEFIQKVHHKMFDKTWRWAGKFRQHQTNIGCKSFEIAPKLKQLLSDIDYYIQNQTYDLIEIAVRLHHGLVYIHCLETSFRLCFLRPMLIASYWIFLPVTGFKVFYYHKY